MLFRSNCTADVGAPSVELPQIPRIVFHSRILPIVPTGVKHIPSKTCCRLRQTPIKNRRQPRAKEQATCQARRGVPESRRSPDRENGVRGVHWRPDRPPLTLLFSVKMPVSD